jgi:hypothetical protein
MLCTASASSSAFEAHTNVFWRPALSTSVVVGSGSGSSAHSSPATPQQLVVDGPSQCRRAATPCDHIYGQDLDAAIDQAYRARVRARAVSPSNASPSASSQSASESEGEAESSPAAKFSAARSASIVPRPSGAAAVKAQSSSSPVTVSIAQMPKPQLQTVLPWTAASAAPAPASAAAATVYHSILSTLMTLNRPDLMAMMPAAAVPLPVPFGFVSVPAPAVASAVTTPVPPVPTAVPAPAPATAAAGKEPGHGHSKGQRLISAKKKAAAQSGAEQQLKRKPKVTRVSVERTIAPFKFTIRRASATASPPLSAALEAELALAVAATLPRAESERKFVCATTAEAPVSSRTVFGWLTRTNAAAAASAPASPAAPVSPVTPVTPVTPASPAAAAAAATASTPSESMLWA